MSALNVFLNFEIRHFSEWQKLMSSKRITKLSFQRYISRQKMISALARHLTGSQQKSQKIRPKENTIVFIGTVEDNPLIKGYVRSPKKAIIRAMQLYAYVIPVNEFTSTMLCSRCFSPSMAILSEMSYHLEPRHKWRA